MLLYHNLVLPKFRFEYTQAIPCLFIYTAKQDNMTFYFRFFIHTFAYFLVLENFFTKRNLAFNLTAQPNYAHHRNTLSASGRKHVHVISSKYQYHQISFQVPMHATKMHSFYCPFYLSAALSLSFKTGFRYYTQNQDIDHKIWIFHEYKNGRSFMSLKDIDLWSYQKGCKSYMKSQR